MHTIFIYECSPGRLTLSFVKSDYVRDTVLHGSLERHRMGHILAGPGSDTLYPSQTVRQNRSRPNLQPIRAEI